MNRSQKVKKIYTVLRNAPGSKISSKQALTVAARLVEVYDDRSDLTGFSLDGGRRSFVEYDIDEAMADGGWRVLQKEQAWVNTLYDGENNDYLVQRKLKSYGVEMAA
jgi:hypothetical protein